MAKSPVKPKVGSPKIHTPEYIAKIGSDLEKWSHKEASLFLSGFIEEHKDDLNLQAFPLWCKENALFSATFYKVKQRLLNRLITNACLKKLDGAFVSKILPLIDMEYRSWRREEMKIAGEGRREPIEIVIKGTEKQLEDKSDD